MLDRTDVLDGIRKAAESLGRPPSRSEFIASTGISEYHVLSHFPSWREAVQAAGLTPDTTNVRLEDDVLLEDWGRLVRELRQIPTRHQYRSRGEYSPGAFQKHFGPWSAIPGKFCLFAESKPEWSDVVVLLPLTPPQRDPTIATQPEEEVVALPYLDHLFHAKLNRRPTYGNPIDFRGLRHEPVNEQGVVFLFGMLARELGYAVEAVQSGYPDCEAKRQIGVGKWQRVRIEFEFESRNFRVHGHPPEGCDLIVCWRHNWPDCPPHIEVLELQSVIKTLARQEE
jgi:Homing endonuclease associated repeat